METTRPINSGVYYKDSYWNDFPLVKSYINTRITGSPDKDWIDFCITNGYLGRALILNCGNGWVERELIDRGMVSSCLAIDISPTLVAQAIQERGSRDVEYLCQDINNYDFPKYEFDLVINFAALHHTAYLERTLLGCRDALKENGMLITYDYIGPHRNQYSWSTWQKINQVNDSLPENAQQNLIYPHLPTMLITDPTEAIHSELIIETIDHYFTNIIERSVGGSIAYPILTQNSKLSNISEIELESVIQKVLQYDLNESLELKESFFAFLVSIPRSQNSSHLISQNLRLEEEIHREDSARINNGEYYSKTLLQKLTEEISDLRIAVEHKQSFIEDLFKKIDALETATFKVRRLRSFPKYLRRNGFALLIKRMLISISLRLRRK
jgi:SAM-dependent methyltransferase